MNRRLVLVLVAALVVVGGVAPPGAGAQTREERRRDEIAREVERLGRRIDEVAAQEAGVLAELEVTRRAKASLDAKVAELDARMEQARAEVATAQADHEVSLAAHAATQRRLGRARAELAQARQTLLDQAVTAFIRFGQQSAPFAVLVEVSDLRQLHAAGAMVDTVARHQADTVARHDALRQDTERLEREADHARRRAEARRDEVVAREAELATARQEQAEARRQAAAELVREESLLSTAQSTRHEYERRVVALEQESAQITDLLRRREAEAARRAEAQRQAEARRSAPTSRAAPAPAPTSRAAPAPTPTGRGVLGFPVASPVVTSGFGYRTHPLFGTRRLHAGIDLRAATGTAILSAGDGTVVYAGTQGGYGNVVVIDHGGSLATLYAHLSRIGVREGTSVSRGQVVGAAGSTGFSTGPHLHFEVRVNGTPVDPLNYL